MKDRDGYEYVLVDNQFPRRLTQGKWLPRAWKLAELRKYVEERRITRGGYLSKRQALDPKTFYDYYLLCSAEEIDEEENEFGVVSP